MKPAATPLQTPIDRGVEISRRYYPAAAARMDAALPALLRPLLADGCDHARWGLSLLTDGGYPFEFTFTTLNEGIRYTLEVGIPGQKPQSRLEQARSLLRQVESGSFDESGLAFLKQVQTGGALRYGAWVGMRHNEKDNACKVYAEVPPEGEATAMRLLNSRLRRPVGIAGRAIKLQMIGWNPATGELEFYFCVFELRPWEIAALMHPLGLESKDKLAIELFQTAYGRPMFQKLPSRICGFSYTLPFDASVRRQTFSFYTFSEAIFGDDASAHRKLIRYFEKLGVDMAYYKEMSAPAIAHRGRWTHHGLFGVTVGQEIQPVSHIGLRPPMKEFAVE